MTRSELLEHIDETGDQKLAQMMQQESPEAKAWGRLVGALVESGIGEKQVETIFSDWEKTYSPDRPLTAREKMTAFMHAMGVIGCDPAQYRATRKIFITANQRSR